MKKVMLITGAYGGIGEGLVNAFLKNEYEVNLCFYLPVQFSTVACKVFWP